MPLELAKTILLVLNLASFIAAGLAAFFWYRSATVKVPYKDTFAEKGWSDAAIIVDDGDTQIDMVDTVLAAGPWNARGAISAAAAAALQATAYLVQIIAA